MHAGPGARRGIEGVQRLAPSVLVTLSLAMALHYQALLVAPLYFHSAQAFFDLESVWPESLVQAWRPRVLSLLLARGLWSVAPWLPELPTSLPAPTLETLAIAWWVAAWFAAIGGLWIAARGERALFPILGTYACVVFGYSAGLDLRIYPWDLPALAVFVLFVALVHLRRPPWQIALAICAGMAFKETAVVLALFPLALDLSWRRRALWAFATLAGCLAVKVGLDLATGNTAVGLTMATGSFYDEGSLWWWNLRQLALGLPLAVNGGTLLGFLLLPHASRTIVAFKAIALAFAAGNFLFGVITEYRIWFEMIPLALHGLDGALRPDPLRSAAASR